MSTMKRLVDLVDRGPEDDLFYPASANETLFREVWPVAHNAVSDIVEIGYQGAAAWGSRITVPLKASETGDLLSWICLRLKPRSWLGADVESKVIAGTWNYSDPERAWIWAASLGTIAIAKVELEIGDTMIETWGGPWMDIWSRRGLDMGRSPVWDSDLYAQVPAETMRDGTRPGWTSVLPTEDGYVYCWLPLTFLRRPATAFPLVALGAGQEMRLHITLRPFSEVVRRRAVSRTRCDEVPLGETVTFLDVTGQTAIPWTVRLPSRVPDFEDATVFAGVVHLEDPLRGAYMRQPLEMMYEQVTHMTFDVADKATGGGAGSTVSMQLPLTELNGPIREIVWFLQRKSVWGYNEWTNYGSYMEDELVTTIPVSGDLALSEIPTQVPLLSRARLMVDNAVWRDEAEQWWRSEYALGHRGGIRLASGMVYGFALGDAAGWTADEFQPAGTVNASRATLRLDLEVIAPATTQLFGSELSADASSWTVHVFAIGVNWMRFVNGVVGPLFKD